MIFIFFFIKQTFNSVNGNEEVLMSLALIRYISRRDLWIGRIFKVMHSLQLSRCCFVFTLRQGTLLIAVIELSLTSFLLFLLILGATHAQEIATIASADLQEIEDNPYWPVDDTGVLGVPLYYSNNEKRMHSGQHLATVMMFLLYTGVVLVSIHFLSCLLLLYGAVKNNSHFLLPWTSTVLLSLILGAFSLLIFAFLPYRECKIGIYTAGTTLIGLELYAWLVVFSFYRELTCGNVCREVDNIVVSYPIETYKNPKIDV